MKGKTPVVEWDIIIKKKDEGKQREKLQSIYGREIEIQRIQD